VSTEMSTITSARFEAPTSRAVPQPAAVVPTRYVLLPLAAIVTGYTVKAIERKIERGDWLEGKVWRRAPDGRILIDLFGYQKWVESA
jgi:hypothetical protein